MSRLPRPIGRVMLKAVLFDLDGTLLDIDLEPFLRDYFALLGPVLAELLGTADASSSLQAVIAGTQAMATVHPGISNKLMFERSFMGSTGLDLSLPASAEAVDRFYRDVFPQLGEGRGPRPGAQVAVRTAVDAGLRIALATNPIFPRSAIDERARWAGIDTSSFELVTSYEVMSACKPDPAYFTEVAEKLGLKTRECLMVGDDPVLDLAAADVGMKTFHVGEAAGTADWRGTLHDLAELLRRICGDPETP